MVARIVYQRKSWHENFKDLSTLLKNQPNNNNEDIKITLDDLITKTQQAEFKMGLKIIKNLISHENKTVAATALGKLTLNINDETTQKIFTDELRTLSNNSNLTVQKYAEDSLELIADEFYQLEIFNELFKIIHNMKIKLENKSKQVKICYMYSFRLINEIYGFISLIFKNNLFSHHFNYLKKFFKLVNTESIFFDNTNSENDDCYEDMIPFSSMEAIEHNTNKEALKNLATIYSQTFLENGNIRRLEGFLDDDNIEIQRMGIDGLMYVITTLFNTYNDKSIKHTMILN